MILKNRLLLLMSFKTTVITLILASAAAITTTAQNNTKGYYKDIFMDSGIMLTSRTYLPASRVLGLDIESFISAVNSDTDKINSRDTIIQTELLCGSAMDENGILLYPDGEPRFRMVYLNGGKAVNHGRTLGEKGRGNIMQFIQNGGSYLGSCAGAFIASKYTFSDDSLKLRTDSYMGIWPGCVRGTGLEKSWTDMTFDKDSPLLRYYDFGGDFQVDSVRHNGGCYGDTEHVWPEGGEILARFATKGRELPRNIDTQPSVWALKYGDTGGRVISCGSHPEEVTSGERLDFMCAMVLYALDGNGNPTVKATLAPGDSIRMTRTTADNDPAHTRIGDKQYHHFIIDVPAGRDSVKVSIKSLKGWSDFDFCLSMDKDDFAFLDSAGLANVALGVDKSLTIKSPKAGKYYVAVYCATTVDTVETRYGTSYTGRTDVLNGVPYILKVD